MGCDGMRRLDAQYLPAAFPSVLLRILRAGVAQFIHFHYLFVFLKQNKEQHYR